MIKNESIGTVANQRAEFAYRCVKKVKDDPEVAKKYKAYSRRIMAMVRVNGLLATIAFIKVSISNKVDGRAYNQLYADMENWLKCDECPVSFVYKKEKEELIDVLLSLNSNEYRIITKEIMEFANWLRRFAEGMIKDDNKPSSEN